MWFVKLCFSTFRLSFRVLLVRWPGSGEPVLDDVPGLWKISTWSRRPLANSHLGPLRATLDLRVCCNWHNVLRRAVPFGLPYWKHVLGPLDFGFLRGFHMCPNHGSEPFVFGRGRHIFLHAGCGSDLGTLCNGKGRSSGTVVLGMTRIGTDRVIYPMGENLNPTVRSHDRPQVVLPFAQGHCCKSPNWL